MRRRLTGALTAVLLAGCTSGLFQPDPYPLPAMPPTTAQSQPVAIGRTVDAGLLYLTARPADRIELVAAEALGTLGDVPVYLLLSRVIRQNDGDWFLGDPETLEPLAGAVFVGIDLPAGETFSAQSTVLIVGRMTPDRAGRFEVTSIRLRYRANDGPERVGEAISTPWAVCTADPAPQDCAVPSE